MNIFTNVTVSIKQSSHSNKPIEFEHRKTKNYAYISEITLINNVK